MSVQSEIEVELARLQSNKAAIQQALISKGITAASTHGMADFASDIYSLKTNGPSAPDGYGRVTFNGFYILIE